MTKEEFKQRLSDVSNQLHELCMDNRVWNDTALYAFLLSSELLVVNAVAHINELHEYMDLSKDCDTQI